MASILATTTGCSFSQKITGTEPKKAPDPILGEVHPQGTPPFGPSPPPSKGSNGSASTAPATSWNTSPASDPLVTISPTSNAYLASTTRPLPGSRPLAIAEPGPFHLASAPSVHPVPRDPAFVNGSWSQQPSTTASNPGNFVPPPSNFVDPHTALMQSRGVAHHRVEPLQDGSVRLIALIPQRGNPTQQRTYEVVARDYPAAVLAIVQQIDQNR